MAAPSSPAPIANLLGDLRERMRDNQAMTDTKPDPQDVPEADKVMAILAMIESGESERASCMAYGMNRMTFRSRALKLGAASQYAEATSALARFQVEQLEAVIEKAERGEIDHQTARLVMDARKWMASKLFPKQWGDKVAHVGGDPAAGDSPIQTVSRIELVAVDPGE